MMQVRFERFQTVPSRAGSESQVSIGMIDKIKVKSVNPDPLNPTNETTNVKE